MSGETYVLEVFLNQDSEQLQTFTGSSRAKVATAFRKWMQEDRTRVNGLVLPIRNDEECYNVVVVALDHTLKHWAINWGWSTKDHHLNWPKTKTAIVDAARYEIKPIPNPCVTCALDCRVAFPACQQDWPNTLKEENSD